MPSCAVCGEEEFECLDGLYYCVLCQTQSQDIRVEAEEDEYAGGAHATALKIKAKRQEVKKEPGRTGIFSSIDPGRPWNSYEGYTIILQKQVQALIKLGAHPKLEETVYRMWVVYLGMAGVAFTHITEDNKRPYLKYTPRAREMVPPTRQQPRVLQVRLRRTVMKHLGKQRAELVKQQEKAHLATELGAEEFYEGDNPLDEEGDRKSELEFRVQGAMDFPANARTKCRTNEEWIRDKNGKKLRPKLLASNSNKLHAEGMEFPMLLAFLRLGLFYTNPLTMLTDLMRWVRNGDIPYSNAASLLPEDMKFQSTDAATFNHKAPGMFVVKAWMGTLARYLDLQDLPQVPMHQLVSKYILELNLPGELHGIVSSMIRQQPPKVACNGSMEFPPFEAIAAAYIVITLKLLFALDDKTERSLTEYGQGLTGALALETPLFLWDDWVAYWEARMYDEKSQVPSGGRVPLETAPDVKTMLDRMDDQICDRSNIVDHCHRRYKGKFMDELAAPFETFIDKMSSTGSTSNPADHSAPFPADSWLEDGPSESLPTTSLQLVVGRDSGGLSSGRESVGNGVLGSEGASVRPSDLYKQTDFSCHSLKYITEEDNFLDGLDKQGLSDFTIYSSCVEEGDQDEDSNHSSHEDDGDDDDDQYNPSQDLFAGPNAGSRKRKMTQRQVRRKRRKVRGAAAVVKRLLHNRAYGSTDANRKMKLRDVMDKRCRAYERYATYDFDGCMNTSLSGSRKHMSYEWLLEVASHHFLLSKDAIQRQVELLQLVYIKPLEQLCHKAKRTRRLILKKYFGGSDERAEVPE